MSPSTYNQPVPGLPYFIPQHAVSPATPIEQGDGKKIPTLFTPLNIRGATLRNRTIVAPMCQYSTAESGPNIGALTPYHISTLGHYALKGAALVFIEATGVQPNGRISPNCPGLWSDDQIPGVKAVADFIHAQGALCGMQLAHAGRKASTTSPWVASRFKKPSVRADAEAGGWGDNVVGPSGGEAFTWDGLSSTDSEGGFYAPREPSQSDIDELVQAWTDAAIRSVKAGIDVIEIHGAHGYLISQFLSPVTNQRTDKYGGSFENRTRLLIDIIKAIRAVIPETMPLFLRVSSTEWLEETDVGKEHGSWDVASTIELTKIVSKLGVDFLDVSSGGNHPAQRINMFRSADYQTKIAAQIRKELRASGSQILIGAVGLITEAEQARGIVEGSVSGAPNENESTIKGEAEAAKAITEVNGSGEPMADAVLVARQFMREPEWVLKVAHQLGVNVAWPSQFDRVRFPKL
jgi:2,4-dienoyl-CoA reductase-like NADH-dependent reductase (Old Yellow Enzyme family)